ncbi:nitrilase [Nesterenkonia pannonica]|uniref:nitrilase-related carbon-nitrogen hydrolase n=1 Tax=Nesterenkonia pannonica TaxID=1548602 RepID=UPI002164E51A|nr:nitrilase-related carbon-nitrogen hydrolase [Nesterenkonia pannonica]
MTPELFVTGYAPARIRAELGQEPVHAAEDALRRIAREHSISIVASLPGRESPEERGITALLIADDGAVLARYQKVQLFGPEEKASFVAGEEPLPWWSTWAADSVCSSATTWSSRNGPSRGRAERRPAPRSHRAGAGAYRAGHPASARALESRVALAYANHCGTEDGLTFDGGSVVLDISGHPLAAAAAEPDLLIVDVLKHPQKQALRAPGTGRTVGPTCTAAGSESGIGAVRAGENVNSSLNAQSAIDRHV